MKTAMQDLREDLELTIDTANNALLDIEDKAIRLACQDVVKRTLKTIIKRIDDKLLEMEKQQIVDAFDEGYFDEKSAEQYYKETFE